MPAVNWSIRPIVMSRMVLGLSMPGLMIEVGMQSGVLVARLRIAMSVVVDDVAVLGLVGKIRVVAGMPATTVPIAISGLNRTGQGGNQGNGGEC